MQVDINHVSTAESGPEALYAITFTLLSGTYYRRETIDLKFLINTIDLCTYTAGHVRRFRQICEHTQSVVSVFRRSSAAASRAPPQPTTTTVVAPGSPAVAAAVSASNAPSSPRAGRRANSRTAGSSGTNLSNRYGFHIKKEGPH